MLSDGITKNVLLCQSDAIRVQRNQFHHYVGGVPEGSAMESFAHQVSYHVFIFLGNFYMNSLDELAFGYGEGVDRAGCEVGREGLGPGILGTIPDVLLLECQGDGRAIREQMAQEPFQELSEKGKVCVLMRLEQPANCGKEGCLGRLAVDLVG